MNVDLRRSECFNCIKSVVRTVRGTFDEIILIYCKELQKDVKDIVIGCNKYK